MSLNDINASMEALKLNSTKVDDESKLDIPTWTDSLKNTVQIRSLENFVVTEQGCSMNNRCDIYVIGDPHFKTSNPMESMEMANAIIADIQDRKLDAIVCLGDVLDRFANIHVDPLNVATEFLFKLSLKAKLYLIIGNHDRPNNNIYCTDQHPFNSLKHWNNTVVVDTPIIDYINNIKFTFVPYVHKGRFHEALRMLNEDKLHNEKNETSRHNEKNEDKLYNEKNEDKLYNEKNEDKLYNEKNESSRMLNETSCHNKTCLSIDQSEIIINEYQDSACIFCHQEFRGAKMGAIVSEDGDVWELNKPLAVSGHVHDYDMLQPNLIYTGTPSQHGFADHPNKTVSIFTFTMNMHIDGNCDTSKEYRNTSSLKHVTWEQVRVNLGLKRKKKIDIQCCDLLAYIPPTDCIIKLVVHGTTAEIKTLIKSDKTAYLKRLGFKVVFEKVLENVIIGKADLKSRKSRGYVYELQDRVAQDQNQLMWLKHILSC
ncbi:3',5'-cyclic adenosine monophosphate phosphodiesterase CpdA [compost metagenome]